MNKDRQIEIKVSDDGSHTLYVPELDEHYHSVNGAENESMHVFIEAALKYHQKKSIAVLEIGFGTGLNALLTLLNKAEKEIVYHSLELYPVLPEQAALLNHPVKYGKEIVDLFAKMHQVAWDKEQVLADGFKLMKMEQDLLGWNATRKYDVVYFDAFAPEKQPEMWNEENFQKIYNHMNDGGVLTTYCAKGVVRRTMQAVGFKVERLPGPKGKREMLRAIK